MEFKEGDKLKLNHKGKIINVIHREPYGENNSLVYLYTDDWKCFGNKLVSNNDLQKIKINGGN